MCAHPRLLNSSAAYFPERVTRRGIRPSSSMNSARWSCNTCGQVQARRSMHQGCLLNPRNLVFYPFFTHFSPSFAHFHRLDARDSGITARRPGPNGKDRGKSGQMGVIKRLGLPGSTREEAERWFFDVHGYMVRRRPGHGLCGSVC